MSKKLLSICLCVYTTCSLAQRHYNIIPNSNKAIQILSNTLRTKINSNQEPYPINPTETEAYAWLERNTPKDPRLPRPCNFFNVSAQYDCFHRENNMIRLFFRSIPNKLESRGQHHQAILFKREQRLFEQRVKRYCDYQAKLYYNQAQGSGMGMLYEQCFYSHYHPRFLQLKRRLGEPHPVKRQEKNSSN